MTSFMKTKKIWLAVVAIGLNSCLTHADGLKNESTNHIVKVGGYSMIEEANGNYIFADASEFWRGVWVENTNLWRVELNFYKTNTPDVMVSVDIGSSVKNSGGNDCPMYFTTPDGKFSKFVLQDTHGAAVQLKESAGEAWVSAQEGIFTVGVTNKAKWNGSLEEDFPQQISVGAYPRYPSHPNGVIAGEFFFESNSPPRSVGRYRLNDVFSITNEGVYTLTVRPVLYKDKNLLNDAVDISDRNFRISNTNVFERMDFPSVSAKIHLMPSQ
jgi:hypothetical protein